MERYFAGKQGVQLRRKFPQWDYRKKSEARLVCTYRDILYGCRGTDARVRYLSAYEFARHWEVRLSKLPQRNEAEELKKATEAIENKADIE